MNKILLLIILLFSIPLHIESMQQNHPSSNQSLISPKHTRSMLSITDLEYAQQRVSWLIQELNNTLIQLDYIKAMQERNVGQLYNNLLARPKDILLGSAVALKFDEGVRIILRHGNPSQVELNQALDIAAQVQNFPLATLLIEYGADINFCIN